MKQLEIKIGDNFIITSDEYNWILKEKKEVDPNHHMTKSTEPKWVVVGYYGKIEHVANIVLQHTLKASDSDSIQNLIETLHRTENLFKIEISEKVKEKSSMRVSNDETSPA